MKRLFSSFLVCLCLFSLLTVSIQATDKEYMEEYYYIRASVTPSEAESGENITVTAVLMNETGVPVCGQLLRYAQTNMTAVTDASGEVHFQANTESPGTYITSVIFDGDSAHEKAYCYVQFVVNSSSETTSSFSTESPEQTSSSVPVATDPVRPATANSELYTAEPFPLSTSGSGQGSYFSNGSTTAGISAENSWIATASLVLIGAVAVSLIGCPVGE